MNKDPINLGEDHNFPSSIILKSENIMTLIYIVSVLVTLIILSFAPNENLKLITDMIFNIAKTITDMLFNIIEMIFVKGIGGGLFTVYRSLEIVVGKLYVDITVDKLVLFVAVAVIVRQFPWWMDKIVGIMAKPPK